MYYLILLDNAIYFFRLGMDVQLGLQVLFFQICIEILDLLSLNETGLGDITWLYACVLV